MLGVFESVDDATTAISDIIGAGIVPAALEMMDQGILVAVEAAFQFGFPLDAQAILLIEVDGLEAGLDQQRDRIIEICKRCGAREVRLARDEKERLKLWKCRKQAFGAIGRLSPSYCTQDGVVPRTKLPHILRRIIEISHKHDIRIVNVFHAGDGNIHPILLFDERNAAQVQRVLAAIKEMLSPASQDELAADVRDSCETSKPLYPIGGGTSLDFGLPAKAEGRGLSLGKLNRVIDYPARDMTVTVEAGVTMKVLADLLAKERQRLPVDVPQAEAATIGGVIATNWNGPRRYGESPLRDFVIGISAVDGRGLPFKGGGRVVKNVAGYEFCKLLTGSP